MASKEIQEHNYYPVFYWMSMELGLSGVAKDLYAIIFRFSRGRAGCCYCSYDQFGKITGASKSTISRALDKLEKDELISRERLIGNNNSYYRVNIEKLRNVKGLSDTELNTLDRASKDPNKWNDFFEQDENEQDPLIDGKRVF